MRFVEINLRSHVATTEDGGIFEIDSYTNHEDEPCLPEDAMYAHVRIGSTRFVSLAIASEK
jgi:hypothetical protein